MKSRLSKRGLAAGIVVVLMAGILTVVGGSKIRAIEMGNCGEVEITEIFTNFRDNQSEQFVEFYNPTAQPITLEGCVARTRFSNRVLEAVFGEVVLQAGEYQAYSLESLGLQIAKSPTVERVFELVGGDARWVAYGVSEAHFTVGGDGEGWSSAAVLDRADLPTSRLGRSWALVNGEWLHATPTPSADNRTAPEFAVMENGGSDSDSVAPNALVPVEHEAGGANEAGSTAGGLPDCGPGRYRNPETNRCRQIPTEPELRPCAEGYERNPETNRCRRIREQTSADFGIPDMGRTGEGGVSAIGSAVANAGELIGDAMDRVFRDEDGYLQGWKVVLAVILAILITGVGICYALRERISQGYFWNEKVVKTRIYAKVLELYHKISKKY